MCIHKVRDGQQKGFTLIELLVVIGILGILAAALVATIDPFEQLRKAQDSHMKNLAVEFLNANIRYYATHHALPWFPTANGGANCYTATSFSRIALSNFTGSTGCLQTLVSEGELKQGFLNDSTPGSVYATKPTDRQCHRCSRVFHANFKITAERVQYDL